MQRARVLCGVLAAFAPLAGAMAATPAGDAAAVRIAEINRATWGVRGGAGAAPESGFGPNSGSPPGDDLPPAAQAQIDAMRISRERPEQLVSEMDAMHRAAASDPDPARRAELQKAYQQTLNDLQREAATRSLLRDLYAPDQLREQMTWFWFNQFNVHARKRDIRALVGDYEDCLRNRALGSFRDLLEATLRHPAMLRYLDNDQNAAGRINENYAREIMELHTLGVGSGYSQKDVQELARILTGVGVRVGPDAPRLPPRLQPLYLRDGLFEFNPARHDFGSKQFLGQTIAGAGYAEVSRALDLIAAAPATARHVSTRIATYFMGDNPPPAVIDRMVSAWQRSNGDIARVLAAMMATPDYARSLGGAFKDPVHYVVSAVRYTYGDRVILNADPLLGWLKRMGEGLYDHETPDGYPLNAAAWTGPGQMAVRFEIARTIGNGAAGLFRPRDGTAEDRPAFPQLQNATWFGGMAAAIGPQTRAVLDQATTPQEWNMLLLASPEFMRR